MKGVGAPIVVTGIIFGLLIWIVLELFEQRDLNDYVNACRTDQGVPVRSADGDIVCIRDGDRIEVDS